MSGVWSNVLPPYLNALFSLDHIYPEMFFLIPTRLEEGQEMSGAATAEGYEEEEEDTENFTFCDLLFF